IELPKICKICTANSSTNITLVANGKTYGLRSYNPRKIIQLHPAICGNSYGINLLETTIFYPVRAIKNIRALVICIKNAQADRRTNNVISLNRTHPWYEYAFTGTANIEYCATVWSGGTDPDILSKTIHSKANRACD